MKCRQHNGAMGNWDMLVEGDRVKIRQEVGMRCESRRIWKGCGKASSCQSCHSRGFDCPSYTFCSSANAHVASIAPSDARTIENRICPPFGRLPQQLTYRPTASRSARRLRWSVLRQPRQPAAPPMSHSQTSRRFKADGGCMRQFCHW